VEGGFLPKGEKLKKEKTGPSHGVSPEQKVLDQGAGPLFPLTTVRPRKLNRKSSEGPSFLHTNKTKGTPL